MTLSKNINLRWTPGALRKLGRYIRSDLSYSECAILLNVSRNAVIGACWRHRIHLTAAQAAEHKARAPYERERGLRAPQWNKGADERKYIEPWKDYTARKQRERAETKARKQITVEEI
jgi:hypothetical protein